MTFDVKKYPGYTEMLFRNRKPTLTRKKSLETFYTGDNKQVYLYDFYNTVFSGFFILRQHCKTILCKIKNSCYMQELSSGQSDIPAV